MCTPTQGVCGSLPLAACLVSLFVSVCRSCVPSSSVQRPPIPRWCPVRAWLVFTFLHTTPCTCYIGQGTGRWHTRGGRVVGGDRRIPSYGGDYRYAREDKGVEVQLLLFESFGGFGKGVR